MKSYCFKENDALADLHFYSAYCSKSKNPTADNKPNVQEKAQGENIKVPLFLFPCHTAFSVRPDSYRFCLVL